MSMKKFEFYEKSGDQDWGQFRIKNKTKLIGCVSAKRVCLQFVQHDFMHGHTSLYLDCFKMPPKKRILGKQKSNSSLFCEKFKQPQHKSNSTKEKDFEEGNSANANKFQEQWLKI